MITVVFGLRLHLCTIQILTRRIARGDVDKLRPQYLTWDIRVIESMNSIIRQVCRNVKRWRNAKVGLRWTSAGMLGAKKSFRRLKAHKNLLVLKAALQSHRTAQTATPAVDRLTEAA